MKPLLRTGATAEDIAWAAGVFEGEGCLAVKKGPRDRNIAMQLTISMTDEDVIRKFHRVFGMGTVRGPYAWGGKPMWKWCVGRFEHVQAVCALMWKHLCSRRRAKIVASLTQYAGAYTPRPLVTQCPQGHRYTPKNTYVWGNRRSCRKCSRVRSLASYYRNRK